MRQPKGGTANNRTARLMALGVSRRPGLWVVVVMLAGCGGSAPRSVFVLAQPPAGAVAVQTWSGVHALTVLPVSLPDYLDSTDMLRQAGAHRVVASTTGMWGERLSEAITDAVRSQLQIVAPAWHIGTGRSSPDAPVLLIDITSLAVGADGLCSLRAAWQILPAAGGAPLVAAEGGFTAAGNAISDAAFAASVSAVTQQLVAAIATRLPKILPPR